VNNIGHNLCTLDGLNSVHVTGVISMSTSLTSGLPCGSFGVTGLGRIKCVKISELRTTNAIPMVKYHPPDQSPLATS
jgi:hypothetical protein